MDTARKSASETAAPVRDPLNPNARRFEGSPKDYSLTLVKGLSILEMFDETRQHVTFQDAATHLSTSRATARRLILTLQAMGYLEKDKTGFCLTSRCLRLSRSFLSHNSIIGILSEKVCSLSESIDCPCSIVSLSGADVMFLCRDPSRRVYASQLALGDRLPAHASAGGKLLLSCKSDEEIRTWVEDHEPRPVTPATHSTAGALLSDLGRIRDRGYATADEELSPGMVSLAVPIRDHLSVVRLALIISQAKSRGDLDNFVAQKLAPLTEAADQMSRIYSNFLRHNA